MTRRGKWLLAFGVTSTLIAAACAGAVFWLDRDADRTEANCSSQVQAFEQTVQVSRKWTEKEIPGIGDYLDIHWLGKPASDPCSRAPGPTDWYYQGFVRLRPQDATALRAAKEWKPQAPEQIWPDLMPYAPANPQWLRTSIDTLYHGAIHLDPGTGTLFFSLVDG
ncbi:MAG TPA: hypothetical protein VFC19_06345 [Candidatus Limnocylindrales bacterium]|nr:hypothetical protein [Candidatus Limnocylindrales bacterium]